MDVLMLMTVFGENDTYQESMHIGEYDDTSDDTCQYDIYILGIMVCVL